MKKLLTIIGLVVFGAAVIVIGIDIYLAIQYGLPSTLSWQLYIASKSEPAIPLAYGFVNGLLMAHFFWNQAGTVPSGYGPDIDGDAYAVMTAKK